MVENEGNQLLGQIILLSALSLTTYGTYHLHVFPFDSTYPKL
jgi:hypothetical protein